jgi:hypothetical protein
VSRTTITAVDKIYLVSPDDRVRPEDRFRAFIAGQPVELDQASQQLLPVRVPVKVTVIEPGFSVQVKSDNWFVIAGILKYQFPLLAAQSYTIHFTLSASGYSPLPISATVPQTPAGQMPALVALPALETEMQRLP